MLSMPKGIEVKILVDDEVSKEFPYPDDVSNHQAAREGGEQGEDRVPDQAPKTSVGVVRKYIRSQTGKKFSIQISVKKPFSFEQLRCDALGFVVFVDARYVRSPLLRREIYENAAKYDWEQEVDGVRIAADVNDGVEGIKPFEFASITTSKQQTRIKNPALLDLFNDHK